MDLERLQAAGLYDPAAPGADERRELLAFLHGQGCTFEEMQVAHANGRLFALAGDRRIRPVVGLLSLREAAARLETEPTALLRAWRAMGLTVPDEATPLLTDADVEALQTYLEVCGFLGEDLALGLARVVGTSLARISEAESSAMRTGMEVIDVARSGSEVETARAFGAVAQLVPRIGQMLDAVHRQHLEATRVHFELMDTGEGTRFRCGIGFADLSGFTQMAHHLGLAELSQLLTVFEDQATETVHGHGGRVVKFLGDAVMWVAVEPGALARIAHDLVHHPKAQMDGIAVRAGVAHGTVLAQDGDYFGPPVNLASRLVAVAEPGQVLAAADVVDALTEEWVATAQEPVALRGFDERVPVVALGLAGQHERAAQRPAPCDD